MAELELRGLRNGRQEAYVRGRRGFNMRVTGSESEVADALSAYERVSGVVLPAPAWLAARMERVQHIRGQMDLKDMGVEHGPQ